MIHTYHRSHSFIVVETEERISMITQLYNIGVYAIINNDPSLQFNLQPGNIVKIEKDLNKQLKAGIIKDLKFGVEITVTDETGFWEEVE